ncbi:TIGR02281 family clan AA aspartic protease [Noviherbaspirillum cavernae]|uniref:TIGR02281 family clan AA aspartic protease n=1 Tax=Noviherbaspirillum cavernae TaxID=2320862 RepID=A0A418WZR1_9BURK|nr:TIGR02281 family clan AA aspartic protease [Noviherbaspirillum cavernae]RJG05573.1 TIGR02281 family clan AA aspartic protease [Noviherbaspirillum cavernae]
MRAISLSVLLLAISNTVSGADISVVGLFPNKAVLVIDGGSPKTYSVGSTVADGMKLVAVNDSGATLESNGKRQTIALGGHVNRSVSGGIASTTLKADGQGHFVMQGQINGGTVRMLLDTGATSVALPASEAMRLGIDYRKGQLGQVSTANGVVSAYRVKLNTVKVGDIELNQVDGTVMEQGLPIVLLGMSFLNRTEMRREGEMMTLTKRF